MLKERASGMYRLSVGGAQHCTATLVIFAHRQLHSGAHAWLFCSLLLSAGRAAVGSGHLYFAACNGISQVRVHHPPSNSQAFYLARTASDIPSDLTIPSLFIAIICEWTWNSIAWVLSMHMLVVRP